MSALLNGAPWVGTLTLDTDIEEVEQWIDKGRELGLVAESTSTDVVIDLDGGAVITIVPAVPDPCG